jgi:hypothetical protein
MYYLAGALRLSSRFIDGRSNKIVFSEWVSNSNCSAPIFDNGLHLYKCCMNFGMKELKIINKNNTKLKFIFNL